MSSSMALWDMVAPPDSSCCNRPKGQRRPGTCERCGSTIRNPVPNKHYCSERCRKRAERARWKAKWKAKGVNKYIGGAK